MNTTFENSNCFMKASLAEIAVPLNVKSDGNLTLAYNYLTWKITLFIYNFIKSCNDRRYCALIKTAQKLGAI